MIATTALQLSGWYMFALLVLPFAGAYGASTYRALQIQAYRHQRGETRVSPAVVGFVGVAAMTVLPLWPLGLVAFTVVLRHGRASA